MFNTLLKNIDICQYKQCKFLEVFCSSKAAQSLMLSIDSNR